MARRGIEFDSVRRVAAQALGQPGRRTFRLLVEGDEGVACLWLEKEQLQALGMAIERVLAQVGHRARREGEPPDPETFAPPYLVEFQIGRLALGYDGERGLLVVLAHEVLDEESESEDDDPTFACRLTRSQGAVLSRQIGAVVAAGRPRCPLCGAPLDPGVRHVCPGANGHFPIAASD